MTNAVTMELDRGTVLREAAQVMEQENLADKRFSTYSCVAVFRVALSAGWRTVRPYNRRVHPRTYYARLMSPTRHRDLLVDDFDQAAIETGVQAHDIRILALCFAAAVSDDSK